jgi:hypothetical protein
MTPTLSFLVISRNLSLLITSAIYWFCILMRLHKKGYEMLVLSFPLVYVELSACNNKRTTEWDSGKFYIERFIRIYWTVWICSKKAHIIFLKCLLLWKEYLESYNGDASRNACRSLCEVLQRGMGYLLYKIHFFQSCCVLTCVITQKNEHLRIVMLCVGPQFLICVTLNDVT